MSILATAKTANLKQAKDYVPVNSNHKVVNKRKKYTSAGLTTDQLVKTFGQQVVVDTFIRMLNIDLLNEARATAKKPKDQRVSTVDLSNVKEI